MLPIIIIINHNIKNIRFVYLHEIEQIFIGKIVDRSQQLQFVRGKEIQEVTIFFLSNFHNSISRNEYSIAVYSDCSNAFFHGNK